MVQLFGTGTARCPTNVQNPKLCVVTRVQRFELKVDEEPDEYIFSCEARSPYKHKEKKTPSSPKPTETTQILKPLTTKLSEQKANLSRRTFFETHIEPAKTPFYRHPEASWPCSAGPSDGSHGPKQIRHGLRRLGV